MKKLLIFLMIAIPLVVILVVNLTVNIVTGLVSISVESISLDKTEIRANIEEVVSLEASILPKNATNKDIIWQSTNEEVARVDLNGNITFIGFGNGYITATTVDGNKRASCYFYVTDTEVHQVMLMSDDMQNGNYYVGINEDLQLKSVIIPVEAINKGVIYTSEDESIATVDVNGLVHGVSEGRVKITSTSESKENISDSIIVEVVKPVERVEVLSDKAVTSFSSYQISYSVYPNDASISSVIYTSSDNEIATVSPSGLVTFLRPGKVIIEIKSVQGNKKTQVEVEFTDGYASDLILDVQTIEKSINDGGMYIGYTTIPQSVDVDVEFSSDDENVVYVDDSGYVQFIGGGNTLIHAKIKKNESEYIDKVIRVFIESPATGIILDDEYVVATKEFKLEPKSYPSTSTNTYYAYFSNDTSIATVDENGVVTFLRDEYISVPIDVYANTEKNIRKTVNITYTNGYPTDIELENEDIVLNFGDIYQIGYTIHPINVEREIADVKFEILSQNGNGDNGVLEVLEDGSIRTLGGGNATVEVSCALHNGTRIRKNINITINKKVEDIEFYTDLDFVNGEYVTSLQTVQFEISPVTQDATNKNVGWRFVNNTAIKSGANEITFNNAGVAEIEVFSEDGNVGKIIYVRYMKSNLIYAGITEIPESIVSGEELEIKLLSLLPSNASANLSLKINNQFTSSDDGKVIEIIGQNKIKGISGGTANLVVKVSNLQYTYTINVVKLSEEILVTPSNITTTKDRLILQTEVLPVDTTNKEVMFEVLNQDVATIDGHTLIFSKVGIANIKATAADGSGAITTFTIEKVAKGTGDIELTGEPIIMQVGEANLVNLTNVSFDYDSKEYIIRTQTPEISGNQVIEIIGDEIRALSIGTATVDCILTNDFGEEKIISIEVDVIQISEDIEFDTELQLLLGEYATARERVALNFNVLPSNTANKNYRTRILRFNSSVSDYVSPYIEENEIVFGSVGVAVVEVSAEDDGAVKQFRIRYTGGDAVDAILNVNGQKVLSVGETFELGVENWIPYNTTNKQIYLREIYHTQGVAKVISIEGKTITGVAGGESRISVELSNGIIKDIVIIVSTKIESIEIDDEIVSAKANILLNPIVIPSNVTNSTLSYEIEQNEVATLSSNNVIFTKPGTVKVTIKATDGSQISKDVYVTSTFGYINDFDLSVSEKTINKGSQFTIFVTNTYPTEATNKEVKFELLSYVTNGENQSPVVEVSANGLIKGLCGGTAIVRAYTVDYYGQRIYKDVNITVISALTGFDVNFDKELLMNSGSYITANSRLGFSFNFYPQDATNRNITCESNDETIAIIYENRINFLREGIVVVKFMTNDSSTGNISKNYSFYYTDGRLVSLSIDERLFDSNKVLTIDAGDTFKFIPTTYIPNDVSNIEFSLTDKNETRIDASKQVAELNENGELVAQNGGEMTFTLQANGISVGRYTVHVLRKCSDIKVKSTEAYINTTSYQIIATAYPTDTYQTRLLYNIVSGNGSVDQNGLVTMSGIGVVEVKVSSFFDGKINKIVRIEYTNEVKKITFRQTVTQLYFNNRVDLIIIKEPLNVPDFEVVFTSSDEEIATVNKNGRVIAKEKAGEVTITATVVGHPEIFAERTFTVIPVVASISLELDEVNDKNGIGGYRVWGKYFVDANETTKLKNTYQMTIKSIEPKTANQVHLIWSSSDESVATVSETGLVTFNKAGTVTIMVEPEVQYNPSLPVKDSYTFKVVDGINYYSADQLLMTIYLTMYKNIVLQSDFNMTYTFELKGNLYGNGYCMDFNETAGQSDFYEKIKVLKSNILIDNVHIRGSQFGENAALSTLQESGKLLRIQGESERITNVTIRNCLLENALICTEVINANVTYTGCIIRNSLSAGLLITRDKESVTQADVTVKDCIFSKSLFSSILFNIEQAPKNENYKTTLHVEGKLLIYNWLKVDEFNCDLVEKYAKDATTQIRNEIKKNPGYIYNYNGEEYCMLGISSIYMDPPTAMGIIDVEKYSYRSVNNPVDFKGENKYTKASITGQVTLYGGTVKCSVTMVTYTLPNNTTYITPASTYETDPNIYQTIRQPFTF